MARIKFMVVDICLPDYWPGSDLPTLAVPVSPGVTWSDLREGIELELRNDLDIPFDVTDEDIADGLDLLSKDYPATGPLDVDLPDADEDTDGSYTYVVCRVSE